MKIGILPFLNTLPLIWGLKKKHELVQLPPSEQGRALREGRVDVALAPVIAAFLDSTLVPVPVAAIGSRGPIKSVRVLTRGPFGEIKKLFLDTRSQTSVLLSKLLLTKWHKVRNLQIYPVDIEKYDLQALQPGQGLLQIGDIALVKPPSFCRVTDLGESWYLRTGKPFVFAIWLARDESAYRHAYRDLEKAKREGLKKLPEIAEKYGPPAGLTVPLCREYYEKNLCFDFGPEQEDSLRLFRHYLKDEGLL